MGIPVRRRGRTRKRRGGQEILRQLCVRESRGAGCVAQRRRRAAGPSFGSEARPAMTAKKLDLEAAFQRRGRLRNGYGDASATVPRGSESPGPCTTAHRPGPASAAFRHRRTFRPQHRASPAGCGRSGCTTPDAWEWSRPPVGAERQSRPSSATRIAVSIKISGDGGGTSSRDCPAPPRRASRAQARRARRRGRKYLP